MPPFRRIRQARAITALLVLSACVSLSGNFEGAAPSKSADADRSAARQAGAPADSVSSGRHEYVSDGAVLTPLSADEQWWTAPSALEAIRRVRPELLSTDGQPVPVVLNDQWCRTQNCLRTVHPKDVASVLVLSPRYAHFRYGIPGAALAVVTR